MNQRSWAWLVCLPATWLPPAAAVARPIPIMNHEACVFDDYAPLAAVPYYTPEREGLGGVSRLVGASLYVVANPGVKAERLALQLDRDLSAPIRGATDDNCRPNVPNVRAVVVATGRGFWIVYVARDERAAAMLVHWSQQVVTTHRPNRAKPREKHASPEPHRRGARSHRSTP